MVLSIALGIVLAVAIIYGIFFLYGFYLWHKAQKKEEERIRKNAEIEELKEKWELKDIKPEKRFSERLREEEEKYKKKPE